MGEIIWMIILAAIVGTIFGGKGKKTQNTQNSNTPPGAGGHPTWNPQEVRGADSVHRQPVPNQQAARAEAPAYRQPVPNQQAARAEAPAYRQPVPNQQAARAEAPAYRQPVPNQQAARAAVPVRKQPVPNQQAARAAVPVRKQPVPNQQAARAAAPAHRQPVPNQQAARTVTPETNSRYVNPYLENADADRYGYEQNNAAETKARLKAKYGSVNNTKEDILTRATRNAAEMAQDELHVEQCGDQLDHRQMHKETVQIQNEMRENYAEGTNLGDIQDLMIKGYCGTLDFQRDFVGEGLDMLNSYVIPDQLPEAMKLGLE